MFWKWFWKVIAILLVLAIFVGGGIAIYKIGFTHGAAADLWTSEEGGFIHPPGGHYFTPYARPRMFFPGFGLFLGFLLVMFLFGGIGRMIRHRYWRKQGMPPYKGPYPTHCGPGWHKYHHPFWGEGPWSRDQSDEQPTGDQGPEDSPPPGS